MNSVDQIDMRALRSQREIFAQRDVAMAKGDAGSQIERARGDAEAKRLIGGSQSPAILQDRSIETLSDQVQVMLVPTDDGGRILDPWSLTPTPTPTEAP